MPSRFGSRAGEERRVRGARDLRVSRISCTSVGRWREVVVGDQAAEGLAAELAELRLVDLLEERALVPARAGIELQVAVELALADVHDADLQHRVGLGVEDEVVQAAPGALDLLELLVRGGSRSSAPMSFWSMRAIISSIVSRTSSLISVVSASACWTRVATAFSTSVAARSVRGLKLCLRRDANSSGSRVSTVASA